MGKVYAELDERLTNFISPGTPGKARTAATGGRSWSRRTGSPTHADTPCP